MAQISASDVKALRDQTGAGMMDCKRALADAGGEVSKAGELLRERGLAKAVKREGRATSEGTVALAVKGAAGALVELACETDFVAKTDDFQKLVTQLAQAAAADPKLERAELLLEAQLGGEKVRDRIAAAVAKLGENVVLRRAQRLVLGGEGVIGAYVHAGGKLGVLVGLRTKAKAPGLEALAKDLAMHVAAADPSPLAVERGGLAADVLERERRIFRSQVEQSGKPEKLWDKIVEGRIAKFYAEVCLLEQPFVKNPEQTVGQLLRDASQKLGAPVEISGFVRFKLGEASPS
ncbi:MAG TPA: translation elongation factor Ts [Myxococcota bacterium]|nr:translation elongation factor Ts [Myxococcota bacterium]